MNKNSRFFFSFEIIYNVKGQFRVKSRFLRNRLLSFYRNIN